MTTGCNISPGWIFAVGATYFWGTRAVTVGGQAYTAAIDPESFSGVTINDNYSGSDRIHVCEQLSVIATPATIPNPSTLIGDLVVVSCLDGSTVKRTFFFRVKTAAKYYNRLFLTLQDILVYDALETMFPTTETISDIYPDTSNSSKDMCVPVIFGTAYIPLACCWVPAIASGLPDNRKTRYYLMGPSSGTYTVLEVRSPQDYPSLSIWDADDYDMEMMQSGGYAFLSPIIADSDQDGIADANGIFFTSSYLPMPTKYSSSATSGKSSIEDIIEDLVLNSFTAITVSSGYTADIGLNGGMYVKKKLHQWLSSLLVQAGACLTIDNSGNRRIENHMQSSSETVSNDEIVFQTFRYEPVFDDDQYDSGYIEFPYNGTPQDFLLRVKVGAFSDGGITTDNPSDEVLDLCMVNSDIDAQGAGQIHFCHKVDVAGHVTFNGKPSLLTLSPGDVVTIWSGGQYGDANYTVKINSVTISSNLITTTSGTVYHHDLTAITFSALSIPEDAAVDPWVPASGGPEDPEDPDPETPDPEEPGPVSPTDGCCNTLTEPVRVNDGHKVYSCGDDNTIKRIATATGVADWSYTHSGAVKAVCATTEGEVFFSDGTNINKLDIDGALVSTESWPVALDAMDLKTDDDYVYAAGGDNTVRKFDLTGTQSWSNTDAGADVNGLAISNQFLYACSSDGYLRKINSSGVTTWEKFVSASGLIALAARSSGGPIYTTDGTNLYVVDSISTDIIFQADGTEYQYKADTYDDFTAGTFSDTQAHTTGKLTLAEEVSMVGDFIFKVAIAAGDLSYTIPTVNTYSYNFTVNWGDGTPEGTVTAHGDPDGTHTYAGAGDYIITLTGTMTRLDFLNDTRLTWLYKITEGSGLTVLRFTGAANLEGMSDFVEIPSTVTTLTEMFNGCTSLASICPTLFDNCVTQTNFSEVFYGCTSIIAIDWPMFQYCAAAANFSSAFRGCTSLADVGMANSSAYVFYNCSAATSMANTFYGCTSLTEVPAWLFSDCPLVTTFASCFAFSGLESPPGSLFMMNPLVTTFTSVFRSCASLTSIQVNQIFRYNTAVTTFNGAFYDCGELTSIFNNTYNTLVTDYRNCFYNCDKMGGSGLTFIANAPSASLTADCFQGCTGLSDYASIPAGWK